jgi:hypothetical protein
VRWAYNSAVFEVKKGNSGRHVKKKAFYALAVMIFLGAGLVLFIVAAEEQSVISSGLPAADRIRLRDLIAQGPGKNKHVELLDFYFGKQYIYVAKMVQFKDVYVPVFPNGESENASNLQILLWIRNDRNSNEPLVESQQDLDRFVAEFNRRPRSVTGILRKPIDRVRTLTADAYPGTNRQSLQILWARHFPDQQSINVLWGILTLCLAAAATCAVAYKRQFRSSRI